MNIQTLSPSKRGWGDAAVDGLLAGMGAGVIMALYLLAVGLLAGQALDAILAQFDPSATPLPFTGALTHLAVAGVYGVLFGAAHRVIGQVWPRLPVWLTGLLYGLALWLLAVTVTGTRADRQWLGGIGPVSLAVAHLSYGLALGWLIRRLHR